MKRLTLLFAMCLTLFTVIDAVAHQPEEIWLTTQREKFAEAEGNCRPVARKLGKLDSHQLHFKGEWDDNNEDIRDEQINQIGGSIQDDIIGALSSYFTSATLIGLDVNEGMSLDSILDAAIRKTQKTKKKLEGLIKDRDDAWSLLTYYINVHNSQHHSQSSNFGYPSKEDFSDDLNINEWEFTCSGPTCDVEMPSPISDHLTLCGECEKQYYSCYLHSVMWHEEVPCVRKVKRRTWYRDEQFGALSYRDTYSACQAKVRHCSPQKDKSAHFVEVTADGTTKIGKPTWHHLTWGGTETSQYEDTDDEDTSEVVDNSPNCDLCTGSCSACPITYACGVHSGSPSQASSHALQASCSLTNVSGDYCTVSNFYACQMHTCVFPTVACARYGCTDQVSDANEHRLTCINGHQYWSCNDGPQVNHETKGPCTRWKWKRGGVDSNGHQQAVWAKCGEMWADCDNVCIDAYTQKRKHQITTITW